MSLIVAIRAFFGAIFSKATAQRIRAALDATGPARLELSKQDSRHSSVSDDGEFSDHSPSATKDKNRLDSQIKTKATSKRSEAVTLLSVLQREARLLDLIFEPLEQFSDAQVGAAAREVLKDSRKTLGRMFAISPLADQSEGDSLQLSASTSAARVRLLGKSNGTHGIVVHRGWKASKCELPEWQGDCNDAMVLMPTEVEVS